ncbi:hypothetical protein SeMB42_g06360 [Synchytrium endobioticum]|nr:hypothetical protein SeMB42_g06360 [Synchytrium endobioticum]
MFSRCTAKLTCVCRSRRARLFILVTIISIATLITTFILSEDDSIIGIKMRMVPEFYFSCIAPPLGGLLLGKRKNDGVLCSKRVVDAIVDVDAFAFHGLGHSLDYTNDIDCSKPGPSGHDSEACKPEWITYSTTCSESLNQLAEHVHHAGMRFTVFGVGTSWKGFVSDADDVVLLPSSSIHCSASYISATFKNMSSPLVFMSERGLWPQVWLSEKFKQKSPEVESPYIYLNAGTYLGYAWAIADVASTVYRGDCTDDQRTFINAYLDDIGFVNHSTSRRDVYASKPHMLNNLEYHTYITLDWYNQLTNSMYKETMGTFDFNQFDKTGVVKNTITNGRPCIFHQNGDKSKQILPEFRKRVGTSAHS